MSGLVVLVGLMGAGKSSVGRLMAESTGLPFVDLDDDIAAFEDQPIDALFATSGESGFRRAEERASVRLAASVAPNKGAIVAAGGGWMANPAARAALPDATIVWLRVEPAEAARRVRSHETRRPLLADVDPVKKLEAILAERLPAYGEATYTVDTEGRSPEEVAEAVLRIVGAPLD